jgi:hypothetical protein|tara:strand:- start:24 stop:425 length:402 start_codon:yes stop_codon:yes gene_type:complete
MNLDLDKNVLFAQALRELDPELQLVRYGLTWESIEVKDGYEKPPKDKFEKRFQELVDGIPLRELRQERNWRIGRTDFLMVSDFPFPSDTIRQAWKTYRQALRDITATTSRDLNENGQLVVTWPTAPIWPANVV